MLLPLYLPFVLATALAVRKWETQTEILNSWLYWNGRNEYKFVWKRGIKKRSTLGRVLNIYFLTILFIIHFNIIYRLGQNLPSWLYHSGCTNNKFYSFVFSAFVVYTPVLHICRWSGQFPVHSVKISVEWRYSASYSWPPPLYPVERVQNAIWY